MNIPYGAELNRALRRADPALVEPVLDFLETDPIEHGSGYAKCQIWQYINRYNFDEAQNQRLERAALKMVKRPQRREHRPMFRAMAKLGSATFWEQVESLQRSDNPIVQINTWRLFQYRQGVDYGERQLVMASRTAVYANIVFWRRLGYRGIPGLEKYLPSIMIAPELWRDGQVAYRETELADLPITPVLPVRFSHRWHEIYHVYTQLAALDFRACDAERVTCAMIPALFNIGVGGYVSLKYQLPHWIAALYVLGNIGNDAAVEIIERFYAYRLEYELDSAPRRLGIRAVHHALQRIGTPTALRAARQHAHPDAWYAEARLQFDGWLKEIHHRE